MPEPVNTRFTIRVYGILLNERQEVLLSDESYMGYRFTKFPGGGLEYGEGTVDCLKREIREETGCNIEIIRHLYTTDFFQESKFHPGIQVVSIYYLARFTEQPSFPVADKPFDFPDGAERGQSFRWLSLKRLTPDTLTLPIDKKVIELLNSKNQPKI
ncbi:MAG TPA: NUDIX domain-containing protein [Bacteroidetes bacterium]|nr:NUDIX domain-containing protein [Bacteroidota bacterium]